MSSIEVLSRVQRIIVESPSSVRVINAGPIGPSGLQGIQGVPGSDASVNELNIEAVIGSRNGIDGYLGLDVQGLVPDVHIPESIARDIEAQAKADNAQALAQAYADVAIAALIGSAPEQLNALNELADALGNDPNFATTVNNAIAARATQMALDAETNARIAADDLRALLTHPGFTDQRIPLDGSVTLVKLGNNSVTGIKINANAVTEVKIADGSVTGVKAADSLKDPAASVAGLRTLGTGALQSMAGPRGGLLKASTAQGINRWHVTTLATGDFTDVALTLNQLLATWVWVEDTITIDALDCYVMAPAGAGGVIRLGLWDVVNQGAPFTLSANPFATVLADTGEISVSTTGRKIGVLAAPVVVNNPRWLMVGSVSHVAVPTLRLNGKNGISFQSPLGVAPYSGVSIGGFMLNACFKNNVVAGPLGNLFTMEETYLDGGVSYRRSA